MGKGVSASALPPLPQGYVFQGYLARENVSHFVVFHIGAARFGRDFFERDGRDVAPIQANHYAVSAVTQTFNGFHAHASRQQTVKGTWTPAALNFAEDRDPHFRA